MIRNLKRETTHPSGRVAFEVVSPHGIPDGTILQVNGEGSVTVYPENEKSLWAVLPVAESIEVAIAVLRAVGRWPE